MDLTLVVLAAGIGSRYGGLKQMDPLGPAGEFLIDYSVYDAMQAGFDSVLFVIRRDMTKEFEETIGARVRPHIRTEYVHQELADLHPGFTPPADRIKPWGTVQAVLVCEEKIEGRFAVINADDYYGRESYEAIARVLETTDASASEFCMAGFELRNVMSSHGTVTRGICEAGDDGLLRKVVEVTGIHRQDSGIVCDPFDDQRTELDGGEPVSMNCWGFTSTLFPRLRDEFVRFLGEGGGASDPESELVLPTAINTLLVRGEASVRVLPTPSPWFGMTNPADREIAIERIGELVRAGVYPERLWEGTGA